MLGLNEALSPDATYQKYHERFGWVGKKNIHFPDHFGPDKYIKINNQGFREDSDTDITPQANRTRVVCSGDSFTFGQGVANDQTWCSQLNNFIPNLDTINLGQSGYGVDQSFLWYRHNEPSLISKIHIFAFIGGDFDRMAVTSKWNTGKPILKLVNGQIDVQNTPVPNFKHWLDRKLITMDLSVIKLARKIMAKFQNSKKSSVESTAHEEAKNVARKIFAELVTASNNKKTIFVYLPTRSDMVNESAWRKWVTSLMSEANYDFIDLTPAIRKLPASEAHKIFIPYGKDDGHYTEFGNKWVAQLLSVELSKRL